MIDDERRRKACRRYAWFRDRVYPGRAGSGTQVYFISVSGYTGNPGAVNTGAYTVSVKEVAHPPAGEGVDIDGY